MGFHIIKGVMGSGKSMYGSELIMNCLKEGGTVSTNLPLDWEAVITYGWEDRIIQLPPNAHEMVEMVPGEKLPNGNTARPTLKSDYLKAGREGAENLVVLDEASLQFDIDDQMKERGKNKPIFQLVALCRHVGLDLYFLAQSDRNIDAKLRRLAETHIRCVKTERIPFIGWLLKSLPGYGDFLRIHYHGEDKTPAGRTWHKFDAEVADFYFTHGMQQGIDIPKSEQLRKKGIGEAEKSGKSIALMVMAFVAAVIGWMVWNGSSVYAKVKETTEEHGPKASTPANTADVESTQQAKIPDKSAVQVEQKPEQKTLTWYAYRQTRAGPNFYVKDVGQLFMGSEYENTYVVSIMGSGRGHVVTFADGTTAYLRKVNMRESNEMRQKASEQKQAMSGIFGSEMFKPKL